jgi:glycosyltransferase involved in cell wall biosynthesis
VLPDELGRVGRGEVEVSAFMTGVAVTRQELVAHLFAPLDGPLAGRADALVREMWSRCRTELGTTEVVDATTLPTTIPATIPVGRLGGSQVIAALEDPPRHAQAVLRREHDVLCLSILVKHRGSWTDLDRIIRAVIGQDTGPLIGFAVLHLGKVQRPDHNVSAGLELRELLPVEARVEHWWYRGCRIADGFAVWETKPTDDDRAEREFVVVARQDQDAALGAWVWSVHGHPDMPPLARYLLHMAKVRYQLRVWSTFFTTLDSTKRTPNQVAKLNTAITALTAMRHTVSIAEHNAVAALDGECRESNGTNPFSDDRSLSAWFSEQIDDGMKYLEAFYQGAQRHKEDEFTAGATERPVTAARRDPHASPRVLVIADEWFPNKGGMSAFNRYLCIAMAAAGAEVFCLLPAASSQERADAEHENVHLVKAVMPPGGTQEQALTRRPSLPGNVPPDVVIGHGRVTGPMAKVQADDHFRDAARLHFVHMQPDEVEWHKLDREDDAGVVAETRSRIELDLSRDATRAVAVGPVLSEWLKRDLGVFDDSRPVLRFDPGFDGAHPARVPLGGVPQILVMGRVDDIHVKGVDIAARAIGRAAKLRTPREKWELLIRGAPIGEAATLRTSVKAWIDHSSVGVVVRSFAADFDRIGEDLRRASLMLMPSRVEGFGLVGLEAIIAGTPVLVSGESGLGRLLRKELAKKHWSRMVVPVENDEEIDTDRWASMINTVMLDREAAFARASEVRAFLSSKLTWAKAVHGLFDAVRAAGV